MPHRLPSRCCLALALAWCTAAPAAVGYIGSGSGLVLQAQGQGTVVGAWRGQAPIQGFSGYGQVHWKRLCLGAPKAGEQLRWQACRFADRAQVWKLAGGRLRNEAGECAERERDGRGARVLAAACSEAAAQRWQAFNSTPADAVGAAIASPLVRTAFLRTAAAAPAGTVISLATGRALDANALATGAASGPKVMNLGAGDVLPLPAD
jgi:hypothetical protein